MSWIDGARQRVRELFRPSRVEDDLDEELRDHFAREVAHQQRLGSADGATRRAKLNTGSARVAKEAVADGRTGRILADGIHDLRFGARGIRRNPGLAAAVVLSFALGIGGATAIFSVVYAVLLRPLPYPQSEQLHGVRVWWGDFSASLSYADVATLSADSPAAGRIAAHYAPNNGFALATADGPIFVKGSVTTASLPAVLGVTPMLGRTFSSEPGTPEALISESLWREHFGARTDIVGSMLTLNDEAATVVGVMPAGFNVPGRREERMWMRMQEYLPTRRGPFFMSTVVRLAPGDTAEAAMTALTTAATPVLRERYGVASTDNWRYGLRPLKDIVVGEQRGTLTLLFAAVVLVLAIAVANVANLLLARGTVRTGEMAVRASLGAWRGRLVRQLLAESVLLGVIGGAAGLSLAVGLVHVLRTEAAAIIPRIDEVGIDAAVVGFALAAGIAAGLGAGILPALRLPWRRLNDWLRLSGRSGGEGRGNRAARQTLVVVEVALAVTVVTSAALLAKSLYRLQHTHPGFRAEGVVSFQIALPDDPYETDNARVRAFMADLEERLGALPGVRSVGAAMSLPPNLLGMSNNYTIDGDFAESTVPASSGVAEWNVVDDGYFRTMGIPVARGRLIESGDRAESMRVAVVSESFAKRHFPNGDALGARLKSGESSSQAEWMTIVGIAPDLPYADGIQNGSNPMVYVPHDQNLWMQSPFVVVEAAGDPARLTDAMRSIVSGLDPRVPLRDVATMDERLERSSAVPRFRALLFSALGGLALLLAVTGIYGVMAYHVSQARRDTAIRRALGASGQQIVAGTLGIGLRLVSLGIAIGTVGSLVATRSLAALLYQVEPRDPVVLAGTAAMLAIAAALACAWPARRATRVDPAMLLRE